MRTYTDSAVVVRLMTLSPFKKSSACVSRKGIRTRAGSSRALGHLCQNLLVVDLGVGETVMPIDWLTNHPLTESDGSRANGFHTTADGGKV